MNGVVKEFREFLFRGNVVDLAVAVVIGAAFGAVVNSLVTDLITPLLGMILGKQDFSSLSFTLNKSQFMYGNFINTVVTFVLTAAAIFFIIVKPLNVINARRKAGEVTSPSTKTCPECMSSIPLEAKRCMYCTTIF